MTDGRLWRYGILFVLLWPASLLYEGITRSWWENRTTSGRTYVWLLSYSFRALFFLSLFLLVFFIPATDVFRSLWSIALILFFFVEGCCSQLYKRGRAAIAGATVAALVMSYTLATFFPFTT